MSRRRIISIVLVPALLVALYLVLRTGARARPAAPSVSERAITVDAVQMAPVPPSPAKVVTPPTLPPAPAPPPADLPAGATLVSVQTAVPATTDPADVPAPTEPEPELPPGPRQAPSPADKRFTADRDRYLVETLRPRLKACWATLEGKGEIRFFYTMRAASLTGETALTPSVEHELGYDAPVTIVESSLTPEQNQRALDCMLDAFEGTSFTTVLPMPELGTLVGFPQTWRVGDAAR